MSNVSENLFQAMDIIIAERLSGLNYDKTILCKIEDDSNKDKGEYVVTDGSSTFIAISESKDIKYMKGSSVYVTVPNGDFNQQKLISGRYIANNEEYATYQAPFERYINITENLIENDISTGLLANGETTEKLIWSWPDESQEQGLRGYTRLGFNAKFKSWLASLEPIAGTYGIRIDIEGTEKTTTEENDIHKNYKYFLTSDEFYGDPYNFDVFYKQEKVFDISKIAEITRIQVAFYQDRGSFIDKEKDAIVAVDEDGNALMDNLWIDEVFLSVGYATQDFDSDTVLLYTFDSLTYAAESETKKKADGRPLNEKNLKARWIHFDEEGRCTAIDKEEEMAAYEEKNNAKIHWYQHVLKDGVRDDLAGNFWQKVNDDSASKNLLYTFNPDITAATQSFKTIIEFPTLSSVQTEISDKTFALYEKYGCEDPTEENIEAWRKTADSDKLAELDEQLTELTTTLLASVKYYESEIFTFQNEAHVPDQATLELVQGLSIIVDAAGLKGNYCIYGQTNEILNSTEGHKIRTMEARYESLITNDKRLDKASTIRWKIPAHGTMIYPPENGKEYIPLPDEYIVDGVVTIPDDDEDKLLYANREGYIGDTKYTFIDENGKLIPIDGYYIIERNGTEEYPEDADGDGIQDTVEQISVMQDFRIESYYTPQNTNNTVHCEILKNGLTYKASSTLVFGPQGTNGTDSTLILKFKDDQAVLDENGEIEVEAHLYDYNNTEVQIDANSISWDWFATDDLVEKIGNTIWTERTVTATVTDAAGNTLTEERTITYPSIKIRWVKGTPLYNILQCNVKYGQATVGQQAIDGVDLENEDAALTEKVKTLEVQLQAFTPIPFRDNRNLTWAEVPTRIVYDDQGKNPTYYKNAFAITTNGAVEGRVSNAQIHFGDEDSNHIYYPKVKRRGADSSAPGWYLEPKVMYFSGLSEQVCLQVTVAFNNGEGVAYYNWYQPILVIQNRWPSAMMNAWDGSLTIDEKNGTILSTMMGAGKKEEDNTFTGVLMGDIATGAGYEDKQLGVYGFNHGQQSFGFKDDGTAFIGKAGKGRIEFDGNSGSIQSMSYAQGGAGMLIDLDDGFIEMRGITPSGTNGNESSPTFTPRGSVIRLSTGANKNDDGEYVNNEEVTYLTISTDSEDGVNRKPSEIMHVGTGKYFLQSADYNEKSGEERGTKLDIAKGIYTSYDQNGSGSYIRLNSDTEKDSFLEVRYKEKNINSELIHCGNNKFFLQSADYDAFDEIGTRLDIAKGKYTSYDKEGTGNYVKIDSSANNLFQIGVQNPDDENKKVVPIFNIGTGSFYLRTANYSASNHKGMEINLTSGRMNAYDFNITAYKSDDVSKFIAIKSDGNNSYPLNIANAFKVDWNGAFRGANGLFKVDEYGRLTATKGRIGGWYITDTKITNVKPADYDTVASTYNMRSGGARAGTTRTVLDGRTGQIDAGYGNFNVTPTGKVTAKNIAISGTGSTAKELTISEATINTCDITSCTITDNLIVGKDNITRQEFKFLTDISFTPKYSYQTVVYGASGELKAVDDDTVWGSVKVISGLMLKRKMIKYMYGFDYTKTSQTLVTLATNTTPAAEQDIKREANYYCKDLKDVTVGVDASKDDGGSSTE